LKNNIIAVACNKHFVYKRQQISYGLRGSLAMKQYNKEIECPSLKQKVALKNVFQEQVLVKLSLSLQAKDTG
tara:strand:+ start:87 stop:302 length:216 start_codon:yes stop_codon:yes gene_type:complete